MTRQNLINALKQYKPFNEQEQKDRDVILYKLETVPDIFLRTNLTEHMTASAWVVNHERTKILMAYHKIYDSWSWFGIDEAVAASSEPWFRERIYSKLNAKLRAAGFLK